MTSKEFFDKYYGYAQKASSALGLPAELILAWWSWETGWGTNKGALLWNNLGGIKYTKYADYKAGNGMYAGFNTLDNFVKDYVRILTIPGYGYPEVLAARGLSYELITKAMNRSSYAEADYNVTDIVKRAETFKSYAMGGRSPAPAQSNQVTINKADVVTTSNKNLVIVAGVTAAAILALMGD